MMNKTNIKSNLYKRCIKYVEEKIENASDAIENAQHSANEETKNSAGDKYETGRAMLQMERNKFEIQLKESLKLKEFLYQISIKKEYQNIQPGCIVKTESGNYFIAINAGKQQIKNEIYFTISPASPIGRELVNKNVNDLYLFNGKKIKITEVF